MPEFRPNQRFVEEKEVISALEKASGQLTRLALSAMVDSERSSVSTLDGVIDTLASWGEVEQSPGTNDSTVVKLTPSINPNEPLPEGVNGYVWRAYVVDGQNRHYTGRHYSNEDAAVDSLRQTLGEDIIADLQDIQFLGGVRIASVDWADGNDDDTAVIRCEPVYKKGSSPDLSMV